MNEERTGKCLLQVEHIRGHSWYRYFVTVNQVMVATVQLSKQWLQLSKIGTLGSVTSLLAATLYQGNPDRNDMLWNIGSNERDILHMQVLLNIATHKWKVHNGKIEIISFVVKFRS